MRTYIKEDESIAAIIKWAYWLVEHRAMKATRISINYSAKDDIYKGVVDMEEETHV